MKQVINFNQHVQNMESHNLQFKRNLMAIKYLPYIGLVITIILCSSCQKNTNADSETVHAVQSVANNEIKSDAELLTYYPELDSQTLWELQQARSATAKYRVIKNAYKDNYVDIGLKLPNMGYHFLKSSLVTPEFDFRRPPILVYNKNDEGDFELVAVEYAVPIDPQSIHTPPAGFTGSIDQWDFNTLDTGWWTLHAWIWKNNPDGVFRPMNPLVIVK